ncbi:uncharacterized protein LOC100178716 [Ciona intestinalis]
MSLSTKVKEDILNVAICSVVLGVLMIGPIIFTYLEYMNYWPLSNVITTAGLAHILVNLFIMPVSWIIMFVSVPLLLPDKQFSFPVKRYRITMICLTSLCLLGTPANLIVFTQVSLPSTVHKAIGSITLAYNNDTTSISAWNEINSRNTCCGVNGPEDWIAAGFAKPQCAGYTMGCFKAIMTSYFVMWTMSLLAQVFGLVIGVAKYLKHSWIFQQKSNKVQGKE